MLVQRNDLILWKGSLLSPFFADSMFVGRGRNTSEAVSKHDLLRVGLWIAPLVASCVVAQRRSVLLVAASWCLAGLVAVFLRLDADPATYAAESLVRLRPSLARRAFDGRVVLVTGASDGIGAATARRLCATTRGARLMLLARTESKLRRVAAECGALSRANGANASIDVVVADVVAGRAALRDAVRASLARLGGAPRVDDVFVCAGRGYERRVEEDDDDASLLRSVLDLNATGAVATVLAVLDVGPDPSTNDDDDDDDRLRRVVLVSSLAALMPVPLAAGYAASKAAASSFFHSLRAERAATAPGENLRVTVVCPGPVATNIFAASEAAATATLGTRAIDDEKEKEDFADSTKRMMTPERAVALMLAGCVASPWWAFTELWIAQQPLLLFAYVSQYCPTIVKLGAKLRATRKRRW